MFWQAPKKDKAPPPSSKPAKSGGGKQKEKVNNAVLFDQATYDKLLSEVPKYKQITPSVLSERLRVILHRRYIDGSVICRSLLTLCALLVLLTIHIYLDVVAMAYGLG